jgi:hypothetical protein
VIESDAPRLGATGEVDDLLRLFVDNLSAADSGKIKKK